MNDRTGTRSPVRTLVAGMGSVIVFLASIAGILSYLHWTPGMPAQPQLPVRATATSTPTGPTATPAPVFNLDQVYTLNYLIGHSKQTSLTNNDITVTLVSIAFSTSAQATTLVVSFYNPDSLTGADFAFEGLPNVYLIDNRGNHYLGLSSSPEEIVLSTQQGAVLTVRFALIQPSVTSLALNFNTDRFALETQCTTLTPSGPPSTCLNT